ncbi:hypothetical protein BH23CHL1_BH23CHL1_25950 [soil metagenome]
MKMGPINAAATGMPLKRYDLSAVTAHKGVVVERYRQAKILLLVCLRVSEYTIRLRNAEKQRWLMHGATECHFKTMLERHGMVRVERASLHLDLGCRHAMKRVLERTRMIPYTLFDAWHGYKDLNGWSTKGSNEIIIMIGCWSGSSSYSPAS